MLRSFIFILYLTISKRCAQLKAIGRANLGQKMNHESNEKPVIPRKALKEIRPKLGDKLNNLDQSAELAERKKGKPPYSYISLIVMAILQSPNRRQTLSGIIEHIQKQFSYYSENCPAKGWKNSIRHNLSLNDCFVKTFRDPTNPSKGHLWCLHPQSTHMFEGGSFMRRKKRFRTGSTDEEERRVAPNSNITLTSYHDVVHTSPHDVISSMSVPGKAPPRPYFMGQEEWNREYRYKEDLDMQVSLYKHCVPWAAQGGKIKLSATTNSALCLICTHCTCFY